MRWRSRRRTTLRVTAPPTDRATTKPTRLGSRFRPPEAPPSPPSPPSPPGCAQRWTTMDGRPARRPRRTAVAKSRRRLSRFPAGSTARSVRRRAGCDPWTGGQRRSPGRPACACAAGSRVSSRDDGCSAERCACSRQALRVSGGSSGPRPVRRRSGQATPAGQRLDRLTVRGPASSGQTGVDKRALVIHRPRGTLWTTR